MQTLRAVALRDSVAIARALNALRQASDLVLPLIASNAVLFGGNLDGAEAVVRVLTEPRRPPEVRALGHVYLAHLPAALGRWPFADPGLAAPPPPTPPSAPEHP